MQNYSRLQKIFHDIVLHKKFINKSLFEIEKIIHLKKKDISNESHIFITGLPRSGTTSLLNFLFKTCEYVSLTYQNMPFVLSPFFSKIFNKKKFQKKERLHGDGITINLKSPEALDEIFFCNNEEFIKRELTNYIQLILDCEKKEKYLSKNNLNYKRINLIKSILPNSIFLIPIREPLQHAYSLLKQHLNFIKLQKNDDFVRRYMNYLGHNEFGLNHKPWNDPINFTDLNNINYWLEQWYLFYQNIYNNYKSHKNCYFIIYENLINQDYLKVLTKKINLKQVENLNFNYFKNSNQKDINVKYEKSIYLKSKDLYKNFENKNI